MLTVNHVAGVGLMAIGAAFAALGVDMGLEAVHHETRVSPAWVIPGLAILASGAVIFVLGALVFAKC